MSSNSPPEDEDIDLANIRAAAASAEGSATSASEEDRVLALEDRLASIEPLLEQMQANAALGTALADYVTDLRSEQQFFNVARYAVGVTSLATVLGLIAILALAIFHWESPLLTAPPLAIVATIIGITSAIALLLSSFIKGVFRSTSERHADGFLPPALQSAADTYSKLSSKP